MVILSDKLGFCFGVKRAVAKAYELIDAKNCGGCCDQKIYMLGELINNSRVVDDLCAKGLLLINHIDEADNNSTVIIRAHGVAKAVYDCIKEKNIRVVDMTCINVRKIHMLVEERYNSGYQIVIVGKKLHPEVMGINGWCNNTALLLEDVYEIKADMLNVRKICVVGQTTFSREKWICITDNLKKIYPFIEVVDTLCDATFSIQSSALSLREKSDAIIVIGDSEKSSNSKELFDVCSNSCENTFMINSIVDIIGIKEMFNYNTIGITASASTPDVTISEVYNYLLFCQYMFTTKAAIDGAIDIFIEEQYRKNESNLFIKSAIDEINIQNEGGKRVRGTLIKLGSQIASEKGDVDYLALAVGFELFQTSILIHDDVIDQSSRRRKKETIHAKTERTFKENKPYENFNCRHYGVSKSICIGDYGFFMSYNAISNSNFDNNIKVTLMNYYAKVLEKTIQGELIDISLPYELNNINILEENIIEIYKLKTAWYTIAGPLCLGALAAGADDSLLSTLESIGIPLGIAFQIKDDILGIYSDENELGKSILSDILEKKQTLLYCFTLLNASKEQREVLDSLYGNPNCSIEDVYTIRKLFEDSGAKKYAERKLLQYTEQSREIISSSCEISDYYKNLLYGLIEYLTARSY